MNKSKFLKRSLAAILAILMVVAMVPSALAAQVVNESVPTARVFANPGYSIWVDNKEAQWDADNNAYTAEASFNEGSSLADDFNISMIQNVANTTVTVKETGDVLKNSNAQVPNAKADKKVDAFGAGTYTYTLVAEKTDADGVVVETNEYKLVITVTMKVKSADATIKAIKTAKMKANSSTAIKAVRGTFDNDKGTIDIVLALGQAKPTAMIDEETVFIPSSSDTGVAVDYTSGTTDTITVTAANGSKKIYNINYSWEAAFDTFKLGDFEGKIDTKTSNASATTITVDLPFSYTDKDHTKVNETELAELVASWTTDNEVFDTDGATAIKSGEFKPDWTGATNAGATVKVGDLDYYTCVIKSTEKISVKTKKSGTTAVPVEIIARSPVNNPSAELTGIQIGDDTSSNPGTQYIPITGSTTTVTLPAGVKKTVDRKVTVWGANGAKVELAKNDDGDGQQFGASGYETISSGTANSGAKLLKINAPLVFKVTSEDTKTTKFYTVNINESSTSAFPRLESVELIDDDEKVVATGTIDHSKKEVELVVPFATGIDNAALRALTLRAKADSTSRVGFGKAAVTAVTGVAAVYNVPATLLTTDGNLSIGGISVAISGTASGGANDTLEKQLTTWLAGASSSDWNLAINSDKTGITFTAKVKGTMGGPANDEGTPPASKPSGAGNATTEGVNPVTASPATFAEHIYITGTALNTADTLKASGAITVPTAGTTEAGSANTFKITAQNDNATNKESEYTVIVKKKTPNTKAEISSVKLVEKDTDTYDKDTVMYPATVSGTKIRVAALPYALKKDHETTPDTTDMMQFSELKLTEASAGAKVVIDVDGTKTLMTVDEDEKECSENFIVGTGTTGWAGTTPVTVAVYSEEKWQALITAGTITGADDEARAGSLSDFDDATFKYQMSATYTPAETGASLNSIKSTVDTKVKAEVSSNTVAITVPGSYLDDPLKKFSLDIDLSKLATIHENTAAGTKIVPDEGKSSTPSKTEFIVKKDSGDSNKIKLFDSSTPITKFVVVNEAKSLENTWNVTVKVNDKETSADIDSITAAGVSAVKDPADPYVWNLQISSTADKLQKMDIKTTSKLAGVTVDGAIYNPDDYYDLGADMDITVTSEDGNNVVNYTLKITDDGAAANTDLAEVRAGAYNGTKGANNAWVIKVPEGTDMSNPSLTLSTVDSSAKVTSVNGAAYTAGMTVDLSAGKTLTIVVTAADGSKGTHTVTCQFGAVDLSEQYKDIPTNYATDWIKKAINAGIMGDTGTAADGKLIFSPNNKTERMYFAMMVARADVMAKNDTITDKNAADKYIQSLYSGTPAFPDTTELNSDINAALEYCKKAEIFKGDEKGNFKPKDIVNRMEVASILANWLKLTEGGKENTHEFKDWANIPDWAKGNINAVADDKIMEGNANGTFGTGDLSRQDTAIIMMKAYDRLKESK